MSFKDEVNFCINFLQIQKDASEKSCIYSPVSILNALAMIYAESDGNTAKEIKNVIGKDKDETEIIDYYSNFIHRHKGDKDDVISDEEYDKAIKAIFASIDESRAPKDREKSKIIIPEIHADGATFRINTANKIFVDKQIHLLNSFGKIMKEKFDGNFQQVDFQREKEEAVKIINKFVKDATKEKIQKIFDPEELTDDTTIILINAIYFIGKWATPFEKRRKEIFYSKIPREIDLMSKNLKFVNYTEGEKWKCVGIPYRENKVWMFILLPNEKDGLSDLLKEMDYSMFMECTKGNIIGNIEITIPVFEISTNFNLISDLRKLGISDMFEETFCNLTKMIDAKYNRRHYIYKAIHKAVIKVDESGTEAAAVTAFAGRILRMNPSEPRKFIANHPFMYFIVSANSDKEDQKEPTEILFAGTFC